MLQGVLLRAQVESEECDELRARVAREKAPSENGEAARNDMTGQAASEEMYLSAVEEESGDESMLLGTSTGAEDDLVVSQENGMCERRRSAILKNKRIVKNTDKEKRKAKLCKTIIIEEEPPPARPASGKQLADVIARLSSEQLGLVVGHFAVLHGAKLGTVLWSRTWTFQFLMSVVDVFSVYTQDRVQQRLVEQSISSSDCRAKR